LAHKTNFISLLVGVPRLYSYTLYHFGIFVAIQLIFIYFIGHISAATDGVLLYLIFRIFEVTSGSAIGLVSFCSKFQETSSNFIVQKI